MVGDRTSSAADAVANVSVGGSLSPDLTMPTGYAAAAPVRVILGPAATGPTGEFRMNVDDVIIDYE